MLEKSILLDKGARFHAYPATVVVSVARKYKSMICFSTGTQIADAKNVLSVMRFALPSSGMMEIVVEGSDEQAAMSEIESVLLNMNWR